MVGSIDGFAWFIGVVEVKAFSEGVEGLDGF